MIALNPVGYDKTSIYQHISVTFMGNSRNLEPFILLMLIIFCSDAVKRRQPKIFALKMFVLIIKQ